MTVAHTPPHPSCGGPERTGNTTGNGTMLESGAGSEGGTYGAR